MYYLLGACLTFAALFAANALCSLLSATLWRFVKRGAQRWSASARASFLLALRVLPPLLSLLSVTTLLLPAYLIYEPRQSGEALSVKLALPAFVSLFGMMLAVWRGAASWAATRRLVGDWMKDAEAVALAGVPVPAYRIRHPFPVIALVGAMRPRLFIASQLFETLNAEEMAAAIRHEIGHLSAYDNLKRPLMRACRDLLAPIPCGRSLDLAWKEAAEEAADEFTASVDRAHGALALASAIIKIARQIPGGASRAMPAGAFLIAEAGDDIARRVRQLVRLAEIEEPRRRTGALAVRPGISFLICSALLALTFLILRTDILFGSHALIENLVHALR
jgi:Zn-dependent protease with chaperone function